MCLFNEGLLLGGLVFVVRLLCRCSSPAVLQNDGRCSKADDRSMCSGPSAGRGAQFGRLPGCSATAAAALKDLRVVLFPKVLISLTRY